MKKVYRCLLVMVMPIITCSQSVAGTIPVYSAEAEQYKGSLHVWLHTYAGISNKWLPGDTGTWTSGVRASDAQLKITAVRCEHLNMPVLQVKSVSHTDSTWTMRWDPGKEQDFNFVQCWVDYTSSKRNPELQWDLGGVKSTWGGWGKISYAEIYAGGNQPFWGERWSKQYDMSNEVKGGITSTTTTIPGVVTTDLYVKYADAITLSGSDQREIVGVSGYTGSTSIRLTSNKGSASVIEFIDKSSGHTIPSDSWWVVRKGDSISVRTRTGAAPMGKLEESVQLTVQLP